MSGDATLGVVGLGSVGGALAGLCLSHGVEAAGWTRSHERREWWRRERGLTVTESLEQLAGSVDTLVLCVGDSALEEIVQRLEPLAPRAVAHTAGAVGVGVLAPLAERGWDVGAMHPLAPVPADRPEALRGATWSLAGHGALVRRLASLLDQLGSPSIELVGGDAARERYHAACALLSNGLVGLVATADRLLAEACAEGTDASRAVRSLLERTVANLSAGEPRSMLTGPVRRGDAGRVGRHLAALPADDRELYRVLSATLLPLVADDLEPVRLEALERLLRRRSTEDAD